MTNQVVNVTSAQKIALKGKSLTEVAKELIAPGTRAPEAKEPKFPVGVEVTDEVSTAIKEIGEHFNQVVPKSVRALNGPEVVKLTAEYEALDKVASLLSGRQADIKEYVRNHFDTTAGEDYGVDSQGHKLVAGPKAPNVLEIPGTNKRWSNEYREGRTTTVSERLLDLYAAGDIDRKTYLRCTKQVRVVDEESVTDYVLETGDVELLAKLTDQGLPVQALNLRGK